jgi:hypothetical protein
MAIAVSPAPITRFSPVFAAALPHTHVLLRAANLTLHPAVYAVVLHGSRGLAGGFRRNSDIDLSLLVEPPAVLEGAALDAWLDAVLQVTASNWHGLVQADLALVFDRRRCGLGCFDQITWKEGFCGIGGSDCFGLYKVQKGFHGLVENSGVRVELMMPCLKIWKRTADETK